SSLVNADIDAPLAIEALKDIIPNRKPKAITIQSIQQIVSETYNIKLEDFAARKRTKSIAFPCQIAMYLSRSLTDLSLPKIGEEFGGRDHTTVIHAYDKIEEMLSSDKELQNEIDELKDQLQSM